MKNLRQWYGVFRKEVFLQTRFRLSAFNRLLMGPVVSTVTAGFLYSGFFEANHQLQLGTLNSDNFLNRLMIGLLIHAYLNAGYYFLSNKLINEWYGRTLPLMWMAPCRRGTLMVGLTSTELLRCLIVNLVVFAILCARHFPGWGTLLIEFSLTFVVFLFGVSLGFIKSCLYLVNEGTSEILDSIYLGSVFTGCLYLPKVLLPKFMHPICEVNPIYHAGILLTSLWEGQTQWTSLIYLLLSLVVIYCLGRLIWVLRRNRILERSFG